MAVDRGGSRRPDASRGLGSVRSTQHQHLLPRKGTDEGYSAQHPLMAAHHGICDWCWQSFQSLFLLAVGPCHVMESNVAADIAAVATFKDRVFYFVVS